MVLQPGLQMAFLRDMPSLRSRLCLPSTLLSHSVRSVRYRTRFGRYRAKPVTEDNLEYIGLSLSTQIWMLAVDLDLAKFHESGLEGDLIGLG